MNKSYPGLTYQEFAPMFTAEFFDPKDWAQLFAKSGAKFVTFFHKVLFIPSPVSLKNKI